MNTKFMENFNTSVGSANVKAFHIKLCSRLELLDYLIHNDVLFKINDEVIKKCAKKINIELSEAIRLVDYFKKMKLFISVKGIKEVDVYKIGDTYLTDEELVRRRSAIWYFKKYGKFNY